MGVKIIPRGRLRVAFASSGSQGLRFDHIWDVAPFTAYRTTLYSGVTCKNFVENSAKYSCSMLRQETVNRIQLSESDSNVVDFNDRNRIVSNPSALFPISETFISGRLAQNAGGVYNASIANATDYDAATITFMKWNYSTVFYWNIYQYGPTN